MSDAIEQLNNEIEAVITRYSMESDINSGDVIAVLEIVKFRVLKDAHGLTDDDDLAAMME